jgi:hypothetical protein
LFEVFKKFLDHRIFFTLQKDFKDTKLKDKVFNEVFKDVKRGAET